MTQTKTFKSKTFRMSKISTDFSDKKILALFYKDINKWRLLGCPKHSVFCADVGLCRNLARYLVESRRSVTSILHPVRELQKQMFLDAGLDYTYPFNPKAADSNAPGLYYANELDLGRLYKNKARIRWILRQIKEAKAAGLYL